MCVLPPRETWEWTYWYRTSRVRYQALRGLHFRWWTSHQPLGPAPCLAGQRHVCLVPHPPCSPLCTSDGYARSTQSALLSWGFRGGGPARRLGTGQAPGGPSQYLPGTSPGHPSLKNLLNGNVLCPGPRVPTLPGTFKERRFSWSTVPSPSVGFTARAFCSWSTYPDHVPGAIP